MLYIVTFEVHKDCKIHDFVYHCDARNAKDACETAKKAWTDSDHTAHMFHLHGIKSKVQDAKLLSITTWKGTRLTGDEIMDTFVSTDLRTWRVSGRNLYCW